MPTIYIFTTEHGLMNMCISSSTTGKQLKELIYQQQSIAVLDLYALETKLEDEKIVLDNEYCSYLALRAITVGM